MEFLIVYLGGQRPASPEEGKRQYEQYKEWLSSLQDSIVIPESPVKDTHTITSDGKVTKGSSTAMMGYTVIKADSLEKAIEIGQACPFLQAGGTLEVSELIKMPGS